MLKHRENEKEECVMKRMIMMCALLFTMPYSAIQAKDELTIKKAINKLIEKLISSSDEQRLMKLIPAAKSELNPKFVEQEIEDYIKRGDKAFLKQIMINDRSDLDTRYLSAVAVSKAILGIPKSASKKTNAYERKYTGLQDYLANVTSKKVILASQNLEKKIKTTNIEDPKKKDRALALLYQAKVNLLFAVERLDRISQKQKSPAGGA